MPSVLPTSYGQVIEYIQDRLYLAAYTHTPNESTPFPYPATSTSPSKKAARSQNGSQAGASGPKNHPPAYFTIDDTLLYNRFHADFGPLHIGHLYRFAVQLHEILADPANLDRGVVFWSKNNPRARANAACMLACYMVLIQSWPPHLALAPIAQLDPPLMPFRDAGYSQADYGLTVQDVVYGVWKAKEEGLCGLKDFSLEEYEKYERVDMGDFNWITPNFVAFASPQHKPIDVVPEGTPAFHALPHTISEIERSALPGPFKNVLTHFKERQVGLVVRLNSELYSPSYFTALGIEHIDMIFDDGTCPPLSLVKKFIRLAHRVITKQNRNIAVHCKAGLGRTGCLIGAYLIYRYGFSANDLIAYMRFMRPGMVVGPQQHWLHINQGDFRRWWWEDQFKEKLAQAMPATPTRSARNQPKSKENSSPSQYGQTRKRSALGEIDHNEESPRAAASAMDDCLPAPTPGQPRKTSRMGSPVRAYHRTQSAGAGLTQTKEEQPETAIVEVRSHRRSQGPHAGESEEEWQLRRLSRRTSSRSPINSPDKTSPSSPKQRAVSYTTTTTTTYNFEAGDGLVADGVLSDVENWGHEVLLNENGAHQPDSPSCKHTSGSTGKSGSGSGTIAATKMRVSSPARETKHGIRKTSGRVGSMGATAVARVK